MLGMLALLLALLPASLLAQANPILTEAERGIRRDSDAEARQLRLDELKLAGHVVGRIATVTLDLLIASASNQPFEGKLSLLMPADAVVTGYALDVGGRMIPGQLLEQPRVRNLYEAEVRRGVDPGLAEVSGNRFATRIFPIDAEHPRRFRVTFAAPFDPAVGLVLPLARDTMISRVEVTVTADAHAEPPRVRFNERALALTRDGVALRGAMSLKNVVLRDGLTITGGVTSAAVSVTRHASGERFFAITDAAPIAGRRTRGGRLRIYWDRSRSHRDAPIALEADTLARVVDLTGPTAIDLVTFASDRPTVSMLRDAAGLRAALAQLTYRGATSLAGLDALALPEASACVLVSDGQVTIDRRASFAPDCPLTILTAASGGDGARLGRLARGGAVVRVIEGRAGEAATSLARTGGLRSVRDGAGRPLPFRALSAPAGGVLLVGPMPTSGAVRVRLANGTERSYAAITPPVDNDAPGALWAAQRLGELADDPVRHAAMAAFSRRYSVAGPAMSFLVLETPDQYLRAGLAPPAAFAKEWMTDYRAAKIEHDRERAGTREERLAHVIGQ